MMFPFIDQVDVSDVPVIRIEYLAIGCVQSMIEKKTDVVSVDDAEDERFLRGKCGCHREFDLFVSPSGPLATGMYRPFQTRESMVCHVIINTP